MSLSEQTFTVSYKGSPLQVSSFFQERSSEYILCLHGIQSNKELFTPFLQQKFLAAYSILALDCIGFGNSSKPEDFSYDVEDQAHIIKKIVKQVAIKKLHIIGHSLG